MRRTGWTALPVALLIAGASFAQDPVAYFRQNCVSCHTIGGGRLTGPDLKNVTQRRERAWLVRFITNPKAVINSGDPTALKLKDEARGVVMPIPPGINRELANALLDMIERESALEESQFKGMTIPTAPFTAQDIERGRALFLGREPLANGGPSCVGCHTTVGLGGLAGGKLGPDLTRVFERLQGRQGLAAWMQAPATPTMRSVFRNQPLQQDEILPLVAYFEDRAKAPAVTPAGPASFNFFLIGLLGSVVVLVLFDIIWKRRLRSVRRRQVMDAAKEVLHGD